MKYKCGAKDKNSRIILNRFKDLQKSSTDLRHYLQKKNQAKHQSNGKKKNEMCFWVHFLQEQPHLIEGNMRDKADCCLPTMSTSSTKYIELKNGGEGPGYPINSKKERITYIELCVRRYRRISKRTLIFQENVKSLEN